MGKHIMVEVPDGMEIDRIIFKPIVSIGLVDREIVINKFNVRIPLNKISRFSRGTTNLLWDKLIHDVVATEDGVARCRLVDYVRKNNPYLEGNAFEKVVSRVWTECSRYANEVIRKEYGLANFLQVNTSNDVMYVNRKYVR